MGLPFPDRCRVRGKLVANGNCTAVNIPKAMLHYLGWLSGEEIVFELLEDRSIRIRELTRDDFPTPKRLAVVPITPDPVTK